MALIIKGPNKRLPGILNILPNRRPIGRIIKIIKQSVKDPVILGYKDSLSKEPGNIIKIIVGIVNTVKKIRIICTNPTNLEFAPHSSAPRTISSNPPGDEIKNASTFPSFLILWRNK